MRAAVVLTCITLACGCQKQEPKPGSPSPGMPGGMSQMRTGSAAFHLEIGSVYERFQDSKKAVEHLSKAASLAENPPQRIQVYSALARVMAAAGDRKGAIDALERALAEMDGSKATEALGGPAPAALIGPGVDDILVRLARYYSEAGQHERALQLCERGLAAAREPWQREGLRRLQVEIHRNAGTLERTISEKEKALEQASPDDAALRFLAAALSGDGMSGPAPAGGPVQPRAVSTKLVSVYERLHEIHPEDAQVRRELQSLLERAGRVDEAVKLAVSAPSAAPAECMGAVGFQPATSVLQGAAEAIRIRMRAGQADSSGAEIAKLAARGKGEGIASLLVASQLYLELGRTEMASRTVQRAAQEARSREERRQVAFAREQLMVRSGRASETKPLYEEWQKSDDPCLRVAATQREQLSRTMAAGMATPPPPIPPPIPPP